MNIQYHLVNTMIQEALCQPWVLIISSSVLFVMLFVKCPTTPVMFIITTSIMPSPTSTHVDLTTQNVLDTYVTEVNFLIYSTLLKLVTCTLTMSGLLPKLFLPLKFQLSGVILLLLVVQMAHTTLLYLGHCINNPLIKTSNLLPHHP